MIISSLVTLTLLFGPRPATAFVKSPSLSGWTSSSHTTFVALDAKSKTKKNKKGAAPAARGGFGKASATTTKAPKVQDDYSAFPALETSVEETLVPYDGDVNAEGQDLDTEFYQRLGEIYGFRHFNYLTEDKQGGDKGMSFQDLLAAPPAATASSTSEFGDLLKPSGGASGDLADLLASATGGDVESVKQEVVANLPIDNLPAFNKFRVLHVDPLVLAIDEFFTPEECDRYVEMSENPLKRKSPDAPLQSRSPTVGKDALAKAQRTSTTWYHHYKGVPELMARAARLFGIDDIDRFEEPQTVRYRRNEKFTWHLDALAPTTENLEKIGGQRLATLLVYLTGLDENEGGATMFRDLGTDGPLKVQPKKGSALLFFPAAGGVPGVPVDFRTLHCGEAVSKDSAQDKWIAQLWLRERTYTPTAPPGNTHQAAADAITQYCNNA